VGIRAGGPHIADESWELDRGCDLVLWCEFPLLRGVDSRGVDLSEVWTSKVWTLLLVLHTLIVAIALLHA
jgi:hypothetical protein